MAGLEGDTASLLRIETGHEADGTPVLSLVGELDSSNVAALGDAVAAASAIQPERFVFDLSALRFMDSAGIAVLVGLAARVKLVQIRDPSPIVRRLIDVTGLADVLRVER